MLWWESRTGRWLPAVESPGKTDSLIKRHCVKSNWRRRCMAFLRSGAKLLGKLLACRARRRAVKATDHLHEATPAAVAPCPVLPLLHHLPCLYTRRSSIIAMGLLQVCPSLIYSIPLRRPFASVYSWSPLLFGWCCVRPAPSPNCLGLLTLYRATSPPYFSTPPALEHCLWILLVECEFVVRVS